MQWQPVNVPFLGGVDTKSDERALPPTRLKRAENVVFTKRGSLQTRPGSVRLSQRQEDGTTNIDAAQGLITRGNELCLLDGERLHSYAESTGRWFDRGAAVPLDITSRVAAAMPSNQLAPDYDEAAGIGVYAWEDSRGGVYFSVVDTETGELLYNDQSIAADGYAPRVVAIDGFILILYVDNSSTDLRAKVIKPIALADSIAASTVQLSNDIRYASNILYDVQAYGSRAILAWVDAAGTGVSVAHLSKAGALSSTTTATGLATAPALTSLAIGVTSREGLNADVLIVVTSSAANLGIAKVDASSLSDLSWDWDSALATINRVAVSECHPDTTEQSSPTDTDVSFYVWVEIDAAADSSNTVQVYEVYRHLVGPSLVDEDPVLRDTIYHACLASGGYRVGNYGFCTLAYVNTIQPTYFTYRHDAVMVGRFAFSEAGGYPRGTRAAALLSNPKGSGQSWQWACAARKRLETESTVNASGVVTGLNIVREAYEIRHVVLDYSVTPAAVEVGRCTYMTGGMLWQYDGQGLTESGFALAPEGTTNVSSNSTGSLTVSATYAYRIYYEWTNAQGERERSGALPLVVTMGASDDTNTLTIPTLGHTRKTSDAATARSDISIVVYRTEANPVYDAPFYRVSGTDPATVTGSNRFVYNDSQASTVEFVDELADTAIVVKELDYQNGGELENLAPPTGDIIAQGQDRIFLAGLDDPNKVVYSKLHFAGEGVAFTDGLELVIDQDGGPVTALGMLNESLVVFKRSRIYLVEGYGPSNTGVGEYFPPVAVTTDVGCDSPRSVVSTPAGLMFKSAKGIYLLDQGQRVTYIGADVEAYNAQDVSAATLVSDTNQVRFLTSDGATLLYDYLFGQWATWTNYEGVAAVLWKGATYCRVTDAGRVYQEDADVFTDGGAEIRMVLETGPIRMGGIQGYQRVRRMEVIGEWKSTHTLRVSVAYNYEAAYQYQFVWNPSGAVNTTAYSDGDYGDGPYGGAGSTVYQFRHGLRRQKCQSLRLKIEAVPGSPAGESVLLTEVAFEVGYRSGLHRVVSGKDVG